MDVGDAQRQIAQLGGPGNPSAQRRVEALQAQVDASRRLAALATATQDDLLLLAARLDEAVAQAIELSVQVGSVEQLNSLRSDVEGVIGDMESLRQGHRGGRARRGHRRPLSGVVALRRPTSRPAPRPRGGR